MNQMILSYTEWELGRMPIPSETLHEAYFGTGYIGRFLNPRTHKTYDCYVITYETRAKKAAANPFTKRIIGV